MFLRTFWLRRLKNGHRARRSSSTPRRYPEKGALKIRSCPGATTGMSAVENRRVEYRSSFSPGVSSVWKLARWGLEGFFSHGTGDSEALSSPKRESSRLISEGKHICELVCDPGRLFARVHFVAEGPERLRRSLRRRGPHFGLHPGTDERSGEVPSRGRPEHIQD